jgi:hypothetical protein
MVTGSAHAFTAPSSEAGAEGKIKECIGPSPKLSAVASPWLIDFSFS